MKKENVLSIWIGIFDSENNFNKFIAEKFDKYGNSYSQFMKIFEIDYIDHDYQEAAYIENMTKDILSDISYGETFIDRIDNNLINGNSIIILYDYEYSGKIKEIENIKFIGTYNYKK